MNMTPAVYVKSMPRLRLLLALLIGFCVITTAHAETTVAAIFSNNMVLQRDMQLPVWGTDKPGTKVRLTFAGQDKSTQCGADGSWRMVLDPLDVKLKGNMHINGSSSVTLQDLLVGDVWLGAGQSNMATEPRRYKGDQRLKELIQNPPADLRIYHNGAWSTVTAENLSSFSALLYAFGVPLQQSLEIPIGLLVGARGGSESGLWITEEMISADPELQAKVADLQDKLSKLKPNAKPNHWHKTVADIGSLYTERIQPFAGFAIRGVLWDQGESGVGMPGITQTQLMSALIAGWRKAWGQDFPWLCMQKPSGGGCAWDYEDPITSDAVPFAPLPANNSGPKRNAERIHYIKIGHNPDTVIIPCSDLVPGLHPPSKSSYGARAARVALGYIYKHGAVYNGPTYASHVVKDSTIIVSFTHVGQGLAWKHGNALQGFEVSSDGKTWHWADAKIEGNTVVLSCAQIATPQQVRYAWSKGPAWANLFNRDGLPAFSFNSTE